MDTIFETLQRIERHSRRDPGARGLAAHAPPDLLAPAAETLAAARRVIIVTGFCVRSESIGETDGPPGVLALADALRLLGKDVVLLTDEFSAPLLAAGRDISGSGTPVELLEQPQEKADAMIDRLLASFAPTHVVAIERPGNAPDGHRYSMRGEILDDLAVSADRLLAPPGGRDYTTLAIGDGGNELGLGGLRGALCKYIEHGETIFSATAADHAIPAGISNWGAYALAAALSLLAGRLAIRAPEQERAILEAMVAVGAVDGCTKRRALSVDGLAWDDYASTLEAIYRETHIGLADTAKISKGD
ncbi:MAG: DUF4392 domain-containing protein [Candidatus Accumulibacter sp.]|jgi:hypothetical protein|nr:DUF4392 domain-containing protein [Accumulibacter sp.]